MPITAPRGAATTHPPGLYVLFFTELWERYSFYSLMAILTLYMDEQLRFPRELSAQVYGGYIGAVYFMPLIGGFLADRVLGFYRAVVIGAILMGIGQFMLGALSVPLFFGGLGMLACGSGLLKANISTIVGNLYRDRPALRDAGFNIFYMGINIGASISPFVVAYLRAHYGWSVALSSAGVAMIFALATFVGFHRYFADAAARPDKSQAQEDLDPPDSSARIIALLVVFGIVIAFWIAFYQNGYTLTFWARDNTATTIAPETFQSVEPICIIAFTPLLVSLWSWLRRRNAEPSTVVKMLIGILLTAASFTIMYVAARLAGETGRVSMAWLIAAYAAIALGEICLSPMGLSLVTKVAPPRRRGVMMGAWFVATSLGGYSSGALGVYWFRMPHDQFFLLVVGLTLVAAVLMLIARRGLRRTFHAAGAE